MLLKELRQQIVDIGHDLYENRLVNYADGNISARDPGTNLVAVKPSGVPWHKLSMEDIAVIDVNENAVETRLGPSSETPMHTIFYRQRPEVNAVIHSHAPHSVAWSVVNKPIPAYIANQIYTGGAIPIAPFTIPGTPELGEVALQVMGAGNSVVLQNHGTLTVGKDLKEALMATYAMEEAARIAILVQQIGGQPNVLTQKDFDEIIRVYLSNKQAAAGKSG